jgi:urease accessory protein
MNKSRIAKSTITGIVMNRLALLHLLNLASPALPIGSYSYSQGLESAIEREWITDETQLLDWLGGILEYSLGKLDIPLLARCYRALESADEAGFIAWNLRALASRETRELWLEDAQVGGALRKLLAQQHADSWLGATEGDISLPAAFAMAAHHWDIPLEEAALGLLWSWSENQVAAAIKLMALGQTGGQRILGKLKLRIPPCVDRGLAVADEDIGSGLPGLAIASASHETQYSRLFRS